MNNLTSKRDKSRREAALELIENSAEIEKMPPAEIVAGETSSKKVITSRSLKRHLKYLVPEMRLALIKEPGVKPQPITMPKI